MLKENLQLTLTMQAQDLISLPSFFLPTSKTIKLTNYAIIFSLRKVPEMSSICCPVTFADGKTKMYEQNFVPGLMSDAEVCLCLPNMWNP
jgi:hypothetical protein